MGNKGQSLVELAISFVFIMFLLSGVVEFSLAFFQFVQLRDAVQEGALYGSACTDCTLSDIEARVRGSSNTPLDLYSPEVTVTIVSKDLSGNVRSTPMKCEADALEVRASYSHKIFMPFIPRLIGRYDLPLNAVVVDTVLRPVC